MGTIAPEDSSFSSYTPDRYIWGWVVRRKGSGRSRVSMQQQRWQQQQQKREFPPRFFWVVLILLASLAAIYLYVLPLLASSVEGSTGSAFSGGWSVSQQRQIALTLAQNVQSYRQSIKEPGASTMVMPIWLRRASNLLSARSCPSQEWTRSQGRKTIRTARPSLKGGCSSPSARSYNIFLQVQQLIC
jgi:hypothetical protein